MPTVPPRARPDDAAGTRRVTPGTGPAAPERKVTKMYRAYHPPTFTAATRVGYGAGQAARPPPANLAGPRGLRRVRPARTAPEPGTHRDLGVNRPHRPRRDERAGRRRATLPNHRPNPTANPVGGALEGVASLASHRKSRPPVPASRAIRTPALASRGALTSVALLSQTAGATPSDDRPTLEEVEKKVNNLTRPGRRPRSTTRPRRRPPSSARRSTPSSTTSPSAPRSSTTRARSWVPSPPPSTARAPRSRRPRRCCSRTRRRTTSTRTS
ncbi:hypothetical protein SVIOM342S_06914 [Streptomyces violaceorubidus]